MKQNTDEPRQDWARGEVPVDSCAHNNVYQYAGFNDYRDSQYKCEDCGATQIVRADSRTMNSDNPWSYEVCQ